MDYSNVFNLGTGFNPGVGGTVLLTLLAIWEIVWKGMGLWRAARNNHNGWFIAILIFNTFGILPILYIYVFAPKKTKAAK